MSTGAILRVKKLTGVGIVRAAARHNKRATQVEIGASGSIDARRSILNECLSGPATADDVANLARKRMASAGVGKLRKDAVRAIEVIVSLAPGQCSDEQGFFACAVRWLADRLSGTDNILSADIHRDESAPHLHLLLLPLIGGRMVGSDSIGGPTKLSKLQSDFFEACCVPYGLKRYPRRMTGESKAAAAASVLAELKRHNDPCMGSRLWPVFREHIEADPGHCAALLGLEVGCTAKPKRPRTMTEIFISPGKGPKHERDCSNPIGFALPRITEPYAL